ncbi:MAG: ribosome maturation factor RimM [Syntrophobacteraceae bacterium]|nr:ribosome maturation factor RimM [Syntrophobacteraceae bacterium]
MKESPLVAIGKATKAHGIRGAIKVFPYGETLKEMEAGDKLYSIEGGAQRPLTLTSLDAQNRVWIAQFEEICSREQAEALAGKELFVERERLQDLPEGEYYYFQLIGLSVETKEGKPLGTLRDVLETGSNDVYVVEGGGREVLVPAIEEVVVKVDLANGIVIVDLPEGLDS